MTTFKILSLDGGGSKGIYTLGVLAEVEALLNQPLCEGFDLIYGTSTGAIIATLMALGKRVEVATELYLNNIPRVMNHKLKRTRSAALRHLTKNVFSNITFHDFKTDIGIVATHVDYARPMIFKSSIKQAHGRKSTFKPGFGATVAEAVLASCAAFPFFEKMTVRTANQGTPQLLDGGFVANNPTLFAIADAVNAYEVPPREIRVLSVGVGIYREPARRPFHELLMSLWPFWLTRKTLDCNTNTLEIIRNILFRDIQCVRINDASAQKDYETDLLESSPSKLLKLFQLGRESFASKENEVKALFRSE